MNDLAKWVNGIDVSGFSSEVASVLSGSLKLIQEEGIGKFFKGVFSELGKMLQEVITTSIQNGIRGVIPGGGLINGILGNAGASSPTMHGATRGKLLGNVDNSGIERLIDRSNNLLERIERNGNTATWA